MPSPVHVSDADVPAPSLTHSVAAFSQALAVPYKDFVSSLDFQDPPNEPVIASAAAAQKDSIGAERRVVSPIIYLQPNPPVLPFDPVSKRKAGVANTEPKSSKDATKNTEKDKESNINELERRQGSMVPPFVWIFDDLPPWPPAEQAATAQQVNAQQVDVTGDN